MAVHTTLLLVNAKNLTDMAELHETMMGHKLIEYDIPEIHKQLKRIADLMERSLKQEAEKTERRNKQLHGIRIIKHKPGEYTAHYKGDDWRVYRDGVGNIYWWYAEPKNNPTGKAFRADSKNDAIEKLKASYNVPDKVESL